MLNCNLGDYLGTVKVSYTNFFCLMRVQLYNFAGVVYRNCVLYIAAGGITFSV